MENRVVITGLGILSCIGNDVETFWSNLKAGVCGIETIPEFEKLSVHISGKVKDFNPLDYGMDKAAIRKMDGFSVYGMAAAHQAMTDSGLIAEGEGQNIDPFRLGCYVSSGCGGFDTVIREVGHMLEDRSGQWVSPLFVPMMIPNMVAGNIAIKYHAQGPCIDITTACATSTHSIGEAYRAIKHGYADAIITGGSEKSCTDLGVAGFANARALTRCDDPKHACKPFDAERGGFVMSEGAAVVILEEYEHAKARGAKIYGEIVGYGSTCDAYHATAPRLDGTTQAECIKIALKEAGFDETKDSVYINAHGTGTKYNDSTETKAYKLAFGDFAYKCHISSTKSEHGHMFGATGGAEVIAAVYALNSGVIPPTINLDTPDPECDLDYTPNKAAEAELTLALSDSFGFGGHNACVAIRKID